MTLINDSSWSLQLESSELIPLTFEEPEDFIHEICGKILRRENHSEKDQIAGLFRIYYADFELGQNHNVSAWEILDTYQIHMITLTYFWIRMKHPFQEDYVTCLAMRLGISIFSSLTALSCFRNTVVMELDYWSCVH